MPDRIVRAGILTSEAVNKLSWAAEVFYRRLMSKADDYGRYDGRPPILRADLYPLQLAKVTEPDIEKWILETVEAALVRDYVLAGKRYLEIKNFGQQIRSKSKWPPPPASNCDQLLAIVPVVVSESVSESVVGNPPDPPTNRPSIEYAIEHFRKMGAPYSAELIRRVWTSFESTKDPQGFWYLGKRQVADWRLAMGLRLGEWHERQQPAKRPRVNTI